MLYIGNVASILMQLNAWTPVVVVIEAVLLQWSVARTDLGYPTSLPPAISECIKQTIQTMLVSIYLANPAHLSNLENPLTLAVPVESHKLMAQSHQ